MSWWLNLVTLEDFSILNNPMILLFQACLQIFSLWEGDSRGPGAAEVAREVPAFPA